MYQRNKLFPPIVQFINKLKRIKHLSEAESITILFSHVAIFILFVNLKSMQMKHSVFKVISLPLLFGPQVYIALHLTHSSSRLALLFKCDSLRIYISLLCSGLYWESIVGI